MMELHTEVNIGNYGFGISHKDRGLLIGSCFASEIGNRLSANKFYVAVNPFGVVYNPFSVVNTLSRLESGTEFTELEIFSHNGLWNSFSHHGSFSSADKETVLDDINKSVDRGFRALRDSSYIIITLGTAWVFENIASGIVVNNCHKLPSANFRRFRLSVDDIVRTFDELFSKELYRSKNIILTVSPIRHIKDGLAENTMSKSTLIVAVHELVQKYENVSYFPAYEIMMDELRDYRFYDRDMVHPSPVAVDYIWQKFSDKLITSESLVLCSRIGKIAAAAAHRPFNHETEAHKAFKKSQLKDIEAILKDYPCLDFSTEINHFSR